MLFFFTISKNVKKIFYIFCQKYFPHFSFSTFFDLNFQPHTLKPKKSNSTRNFRQSAIFLASNGQHFIDFEQFFCFFFIDFSESAKLETRVYGHARASEPRKIDGADHQTPRHFNIIAYDWMLGDEWQFFGTRFCWGVTYMHKKTCTFEGLRQHQLATFGRVKTNVPGFARNSN